MATQGRPAFDRETHAELIRLSSMLSDVELAAKYRVSVPTVLKYKRLPVGFKHGKPGKPARKSA